MSLFFSIKIKLVFQCHGLGNTSHFKVVFCSTHLQTQANMTVASGVTLNFVDCASVIAVWVKKSKQWPVHDTRSVSNTFSFITDQ